MTLLKALFEKGLLKKQDISNYNLLYYSCCGESSESTFQYLVDLNPEALLSASSLGSRSRSRSYRMSLFHALIDSDSKSSDLSVNESFKRCLKYSFKHYPDLLFETRLGSTALTRAQDQFEEAELISMLRSVFKEEAGIPFLHEVIVHQPTDYNKFLAWFPWMNRLRDKDGRTVTQKILTSAKALRVHPMVWVNLSTDQLEEKDPATTLRPFAAIAAGKDSDLNLSYQILRQHPSVIDVIQEERDKMYREIVMNKRKGKKRKHDGQIVEG
ncbi:predicted protein [Chaetoceros tenuissimus]|uniref:Uncharacterized protein n=1 Tax=Chaetoceros tenuissimus TaxID=426638 RepID=A0AAD3HBA6_9STRA|nr:predicted protein [Chaetoceros tenuissimus]